MTIYYDHIHDHISQYDHIQNMTISGAQLNTNI